MAVCFQLNDVIAFTAVEEDGVICSITDYFLARTIFALYQKTTRQNNSLSIHVLNASVDRQHCSDFKLHTNVDE